MRGGSGAFPAHRGAGLCSPETAREPAPPPSLTPSSCPLAPPPTPPHSHTPNPHPGLPSPETEELKPILVTLDYLQLDTDTPAPPATRELQVGCIRTTQLSPKKVTTALAQPGQPQPCPALPRWVWGGAGQPGPQPHCLQCGPPPAAATPTDGGVQPGQRGHLAAPRVHGRALQGLRGARPDQDHQHLLDAAR